MNQNERKALQKTHRNKLLERLDRRIKLAKSKGDEVLLKHLKAEADYLNTRRGFLNIRVLLSP